MIKSIIRNWKEFVERRQQLQTRPSIVIAVSFIAADTRKSNNSTVIVNAYVHMYYIALIDRASFNSFGYSAPHGKLILNDNKDVKWCVDITISEYNHIFNSYNRNKAISEVISCKTLYPCDND